MAISLNDSGSLVRKWQTFLQKQGFYYKDVDGNFGPSTMQATKAFQQYYTIQQTGTAGSLTLSKAYSLGFNPDNEPVTPPINSDAKMMQWIKDNLGTFIKTAITNTDFTEDWLAAICARETGFLFTRYANQGLAFGNITVLMKGDYCKRPSDVNKQYHGFGFWQIDIASFGEFVQSGKWSDPGQTATMAVSILKGKSNYLQQQDWQAKLTDINFQRAVTAAYNCGEGNVCKALKRGLDVDCYTYAKDYSAEVFRYRNIYKNLQST